MKITEPKVELWRQGDAKTHVVKCARVCYRRDKGNDDKTYEHLLNAKHYSVFRHETVYSIIPNNTNKWMIENNLHDYVRCPYIDWRTINNSSYIVTNGNFMLDLKVSNPTLYNLINKYKVDSVMFENNEFAFKYLMRYTFCITTQISTSRELNRVSPNNISEQSTRYVYEDGTICRPHWLEGYDISQTLHGKYLIYKDGKEDDDINHKVLTFINSCDNSFKNYKYLIDAGLSRQDARGVLPLDTATRCVYTYTINEWRRIIDLRYYGTTGKPHSNAKLIAGMIREQLMELGHEFR